MQVPRVLWAEANLLPLPCVAGECFCSFLRCLDVLVMVFCCAALNGKSNGCVCCFDYCFFYVIVIIIVVVIAAAVVIVCLLL